MSRTIILATAAALLSFGAFADESRSGTITRLDEANGTIAVSEAQAGTTGSSAAPSQDYKLQDGLMYNALKEGDHISFVVEDKAGAKVITKVQKQ
jgi:Cu/Ag efflux protein CusF